MKNRIKISYFSHALMTLAFLGAVSACVNDDFEDKVVNKPSFDGLALSPSIADAAVVTRTTPSDNKYKEDELVTLDVFVEDVDNTNQFFKQYHLTISPDTETKEIEGKVGYLLENKWREQGYKVGHNYNVYVAVNNTKTTGTITNSAALKDLTYDEVEARVAEVNNDGNIIRTKIGEETGDDGETWNIYKYTGNIYKLYDKDAPANETSRDLTPTKQFMMDGFVPNWSPTANQLTQTIPVDLSRAAAKIVLNVDFDDAFKNKLAEQHIEITGSPAWQFQNFAFNAPVFDPKIFGTTAGDAPTITPRSADFMIYDTDGFNEDKSFNVITYSYPISWTDYIAGAPSLIVSIPYSEYEVDGDGNKVIGEDGKPKYKSTSYNYYRVPIVKNSTDITSIDRNTIYVINATIATRGSETHEDVDPIDDVYYYVLPWNDDNNTAAIHHDVEAVTLKYLKVNPKIYTLRGDGNQSVEINYLKGSGTSVGWKLFTYDDNGNQTAVVANNAEGATRAWFYNSSGAFTNAYSDTGSGITWDDTMGVTITQSNEGVGGTKGKFTVNSVALTNKAIKYIRFRVFLNEDETLFEDVIIRHFPTDNIQNIEGSWSSYHPTGSSSDQMVTLTTRTLSEAQSWSEQYGVNYTTTQVPITEPVTYAEFSSHASDDSYSANIVDGVTENQMYQAAGNNWNTIIAAANSQANAFLSDEWYYWGENPVASSETTTSPRWYDGEYDYYTSRSTGGWGSTTYYTYYRYTARHRAQYTHTYTYTQYSLTVPMASTGDWVDWDKRTSHSPARTYTITYRSGNNNAGTFNAKVMQDGTMYAITESRSGNNYTTVTGSAKTLTNNHMYVIQISSTSADYVLGRPYINQSTHQSQDNVVSPAFMIASQLGAVLPFTGNAGPANAATHCSQYMEVAQDGTRYSGWRLPTEAEISVITGYQYGTIGGVTIPSRYQVLIPVLTGWKYHSLSGNPIIANPDAEYDWQSNTESYLRCVRDLSAEEVERLNGFDAIISKYQNK